MRSTLRDRRQNGKLRPPYQAWIVVDEDSWTKEQLKELMRWEAESPHHHVAMSIPMFEYWLLLHFQYAGTVNPTQCYRMLRECCPGYDKGVGPRRFTIEQVDEVISRAKKRDTPPCKGLPRGLGLTTVYRLLESIREENEKGS